MLLPSAHAGAVLELVPVNRCGNLLQDILFAPRDIRETSFRNRFLPIDTSVNIVAKIIASLLLKLSRALANFESIYVDEREFRGKNA